LPFSTGLLDPEFDNNVQGIRFRSATATLSANDEGDCQNKCEENHGGIATWVDIARECFCTTSQYGAILHKDAGYKGEASIITTDIPDLSGELVEYETSSITTFLQGGPVNTADLENIKLCKGTDGSGVCLTSTELASEMSSLPSPSVWDDKIESIVINGNYLVALFERVDYKGKCQGFFDSNNDFGDDPIGRCGCIVGNWGCHSCVSSYKIIPLAGSEN